MRGNNTRCKSFSMNSGEICRKVYNFQSRTWIGVTLEDVILKIIKVQWYSILGTT